MRRLSVGTIGARAPMSRMENLIAASGPVEERRFSAASGPLLNGALAPVRAAVFAESEL